MGTASKKEPQMNEPLIDVGILLKQKRIDFKLLTPFTMNGTPFAEGDYHAEFSDGKILFNGGMYDEIIFETGDLHASAFELKDVIIGVEFHWERKEDQRFAGGLKLIIEEDAITAVNSVYLEDYLVSVISS